MNIYFKQSSSYELKKLDFNSNVKNQSCSISSVKGLRNAEIVNTDKDEIISNNDDESSVEVTSDETEFDVDNILETSYSTLFNIGIPIENNENRSDSIEDLNDQNQGCEIQSPVMNDTSGNDDWSSCED